MNNQNKVMYMLAIAILMFAVLVIGAIAGGLVLGAEAESGCGHACGASVISRDEVMEYIRTDTEFTEEELPSKQWMDFEITAYCGCEICCDEWAHNRPIDENGKQIVYGSAGIPLREGVSIAADTSIYPIGTVIEIMGIGTYTVQDCGGAIRGNRIDIYFEKHSDALEFGRRMNFACVVEKGV